MAFSGNKPSLYVQITETRGKVQLLESKRKAQSVSDQSAIEKNGETIRKLKDEVKQLYTELAEAERGSERLIKAAFHNRGPEKHAYRNKSDEEALQTIQEKQMCEIRLRDSMRHNNKTLQANLEELELEYERQKQLAEVAAQQTEHSDKKRSLENRVEQAQAMAKEAENTMANYLKIRENMLEDSVTFEVEIGSLKEELQKHKEELQRLQVVEKDAKAENEVYKVELQHLEEQLYKEHNQRERTLANTRRTLEECQAVSKRNDLTARTSMQSSDEDNQDQEVSAMVAAEEEKVLSTLEKIFRSLKEVTGTTSTEEMVDRFVSEKNKYDRLVNEKDENEAVLQQLKEQKALLSQQLDQIKHSGETKFSSDQQTMLEFEQMLEEEKKKCLPAKDHRLIQTLSHARAGVEHLGDKLLVSAYKDAGEEIDPEAVEFVVALMKQCKVKIHKMHMALEGVDVPALLREAEEEQVLAKVEGGLPDYNTRIKLPDDQAQDLVEEVDDELEEKEAGILTREALKRQSQQLMESNPKKMKKSKL